MRNFKETPATGLGHPVFVFGNLCGNINNPEIFATFSGR